ncbi:MAG: sulfatase-like hydrolase/transferase [Bryobacterales bacterium]|nr:sulfatase-like hydrolase/transferase [Bryobacterales bacterium]
MPRKDDVSRRKFLRRASAATAAAGLTGCSQTKAPPAAHAAEASGSHWEAPPKQQGNNLNLIVLVSDTFRADNLECYGSKWIECPNLNRFAKESVIFEDAYPEGMPTIPIRRTLYTGRRILPYYYYRQHEPVQLPGWHELYNEDVTLSETLLAAGYSPALIADLPHMQRPGKNFHRGFRYCEWIRGHENDYYAMAPRVRQDFSDLFPANYLELPELKNSLPNFLNQYKANFLRARKDGEAIVAVTAAKAVDWLKTYHDEKPFYLQVEAFDPHEPWDPPMRFLKKYMPDAKGPTWPEPPYGDIQVPEEGIKRFRANYAGEAACVDFWFGRILDTVRELGLFENSVVVFMGDHGALLGEQGQFLKGPERMRTQVTHIPLLIRLPGGEQGGKRVKGFVHIPDIMPTLLGRLNLKPPPRVTGQDLWPLVTGETRSVHDYVVHAYGWVAAVRTREWNFSTVWKKDKYQGSYAPQLYDTQKDPEELTNVADKHPDVVKQLSAKIAEYMASGESITRGSFHERAG